jgi:hypothetical protein
MITFCNILLVLVLIYAVAHLLRRSCGRRETFVTKQAADLYAVTQPLYREKGAATTYSEFKVGADPVVGNVGVDLFTDTKRAYVSQPSAYSPEVVQSVFDRT